MKFILFCFLVFISMYGKYLDSKSCAECHDAIYQEHKSSMHHLSSVHKDPFHKAVKDKTTPEKYDCAFCHSPAAFNLITLKNGEDMPNHRNIEENDGVSCFYCHQITKVMEAKHQNINFYNYSGGKPTFFANIIDPDMSDKHESQSKDIYKNSRVCMGCHSHKYNTFGVEICNTKNEPAEPQSDCIGCHMAKTSGSPVKVDKKGRSQYATHEFLGIRSTEMVKKAVDLKLNKTKSGFTLTIKNKMGHPIILQPMRLKYAKTTITRNDKIIWTNFKTSPLEDKEATFTTTYKNDAGIEVLPPQAKGFLFKNNLGTNQFKTVNYEVLLQKGDKITTQWYSMIVRPELAKELKLDEEFHKIYEGISTQLIVY
ncbi:MAG: hypothetical protein L0Y61_02800 [Epsilonproteobacteria bacterium]|nr:hypothetical protein [Campylobacterota bacterium]